MSQENRQNRLEDFYHGTHVSVHTLPMPFLDPNMSTGGDKGDPDCPHVFLTPDPFYAKLFAFKTLESMITGFFGQEYETPYLIYSEFPSNLGTGYVYKVLAQDYPDLHEIIVDGRPTQKYVTYQPVDVSSGPEQTLTGDLNALMAKDRVQVFALRTQHSKSALFRDWEQCRGSEASGIPTLLKEWRQRGDLLHLNQQRGLSAYDFGC